MHLVPPTFRQTCHPPDSDAIQSDLKSGWYDLSHNMHTHS